MKFKLVLGREPYGKVSWSGKELNMPHGRKGGCGPLALGRAGGLPISGIFWRADVVGECRERKNTALPLLG